MPTDPYVADRTDDVPRQAPTLSPGVRVPPAKAWHADRPGDLVDGVQPRGARFGTPGPNVGYALALVRRMRDPFVLSPLEHHHDVDAVVAAVAMKRAASFGRAPIGADVECAALALGYLGVATPELVEWRADAVDGAGHDYEAVRAICDAVPIEALRLTPGALDARADEVHAQLDRFLTPMSTFLLSPEHLEFQKALRRFADDEIAPGAAAADASGEYPMESFAAYRDSGFIRLPYPEEFGGDGGDMVAYAMLVEEVARACGSSSLFVLISRLASEPILLFGSEELKHRVIPRVATGEWQGSYCLSESHAGSDVASMRTRAVRDGDDYVLTGSKSWITNVGVSDFYTVFAKTDPEAGHRGISAFVVEADRPGFAVSKLESKMGMRGSPTGEITFDEVRVPAANLIGEENRAFAYAMGALDGSRPVVGAQAVGIAQGVLDAALEYVTQREQFNQPVSEFQGVQFMLADMATRVEASRLLVYSACARVDAGAPGTAQASAMAKLFASDTAMSVTTDAVQLFGGAGYTKDFPVERMMRDAKVTQIYEGTNQIQRVVIAKQLLR